MNNPGGESGGVIINAEENGVNIAIVVPAGQAVHIVNQGIEHNEENIG